MNTDQIQKKIVLKSARDRVWRAISDSVKANDGGWTHQARLLEKYFERPM